MKENRQTQFYKLLGEELTRARERRKMSAYDLSKFVGEQWTTINKMEAGGKFMAHHFVWLKEIGVNLNILISDVSTQLASLPEVEGDTEVEEEITVKKTRKKATRKESYAALTEEAEFESAEADEGLSDLF